MYANVHTDPGGHEIIEPHQREHFMRRICATAMMTRDTQYVTIQQNRSAMRQIHHNVEENEEDENKQTTVYLWSAD